jgi:phosphopentomutase
MNEGADTNKQIFESATNDQEKVLTNRQSYDILMMRKRDVRKYKNALREWLSW